MHRIASRKRLAQVGEDALGAHRPSVALHRRLIAGDEGLAVVGHLGKQLRLDAGRYEPTRHTRQRRQRRLQVGDRADRHRIVATEFLRVDVDLDQLCRREAERVLVLHGCSRPPARAQREDPVGAAALVVDVLGAPEAGHAEDQRVIVGQRAAAHQRMRYRKLQVLGELAHLGGRVGEQGATADVQQRLLRDQQPLDDPLGGLLVERRLG